MVSWHASTMMLVIKIDRDLVTCFYTLRSWCVSFLPEYSCSTPLKSDDLPVSFFASKITCLYGPYSFNLDIIQHFASSLTVTLGEMV